MAKRMNDSEIEASCSSKVANILNQDEELEAKVELPLEIIMDIISYLDDMKDIRSCMELSKEIRNSIFKTPNIMKRMKLSIIRRGDFDGKINFLKSKGEFIRILALGFCGKSEKLTRFILHLAPNLEELDYKDFEENYAAGYDEQFFNSRKLEFFQVPAILPKLKALEIHSFHFKDFIQNVKNVSNLEKFNCTLVEKEHEEIFLDFLIRQNNLKDLNLRTIYFDIPVTFPSRDISMEVKFQLKTLELNCGYIDNENFYKFFQGQVEKLKELYLTYLSEEILEILFKYSRKLITISNNGSTLFSDLYPHWKLNTVKCLVDDNSNGLNLNAAYEKFPNVDSIRCDKIFETSGSFDKLHHFKVNRMFVDKMKNIKLPNLKSLFIRNLEEITDEIQWTNFLQNISNVQKLTIKYTNVEANQNLIYKSFKNCTSLPRNVHIWYDEKFEYDSVNDYQVDPIHHKVSIDFEKKVVRSDEVMFKMEMVRENFKDFELIQCIDPEIQALNYAENLEILNYCSD